MAKLNIGFAETVARDQFGQPIPVQTVPPDDSMWPETVSITADPGTMSSLFPKRTRWLRLQCDVRCEFWVAEGGGWNIPASGGFTMEAGQTEMFGLDGDKYPDPTVLRLRVRIAA